jgi:hypothetical protein
MVPDGSVVAALADAGLEGRVDDGVLLDGDADHVIALHQRLPDDSVRAVLSTRKERASAT